MPQLGELLERFRHAAAPGAPAAAGGVPADPAAELQAEVRPLLAALDEIDDEARAVVAAAEAEAAAQRERAARDAERVMDEARAVAARLRAAPPPEDGDGDESDAIVAAARAEADEIRRRARGHIPGMVDGVIACVRGGVGLEPAREASDVACVGRG